MFGPEKKISVILPCLDEERALPSCLEEVSAALSARRESWEIIAVDNGSTDKTAAVLEDAKKSYPSLKAVSEKRRGYGFAYLRGLKEATGDYIFMADADGSYDLGEVGNFVDALEGGLDLVVGNRFSGKMAKSAMPWTHRYLGNPCLSFLVRWLFGAKIKDIHCGARAITAEALGRVTLYTGGMEFASEMVIKAARAGLRIGELPVVYRPRIGESKLKPVSDAWRHLRFILLYSPLALFFIPGAFLFLLGLVMMAVFMAGNPNILGRQFYVHPLFLFSSLLLFGYQLIIFGGFAKIYAINHFGDHSRLMEKLFRHITIERVGLPGLLVCLTGIVIYVSIFWSWARSGYGELASVKESILGLTLIVFGAQTFFSAFMFSILGIKEK